MFAWDGQDWCRVHTHVDVAVPGPRPRPGTSLVSCRAVAKPSSSLPSLSALGELRTCRRSLSCFLRNSASALWSFGPCGGSKQVNVGISVNTEVTPCVWWQNSSMCSGLIILKQELCLWTESCDQARQLRNRKNKMRRNVMSGPTCGHQSLMTHHRKPQNGQNWTVHQVRALTCVRTVRHLTIFTKNFQLPYYHCVVNIFQEISNLRKVFMFVLVEHFSG